MASLALWLNEHLPAGWYAEPHVHMGIEIDVAALEDADDTRNLSEEGPERWAPPSPAMTLDFPLAEEEFAVRIMGDANGPEIVGAIELISRANKDRPASREAFVSKCETYLRAGMGLVIVDIVSNRHADLHVQLLERVEAQPAAQNSPLYTAAYRPHGKNSTAKLEVWREELTIGGVIPTMPLYLKNGPVMPLDLSETYRQALKTIGIAH